MDKKTLKKIRRRAQQDPKKNLMPKKKPIVFYTDDNSGVIYSIRGENVSKDEFMKSVDQQGSDEMAGAGGYSEGGEVRGAGVAVTGKGFKGVF
tara:strand:- start:192 stop:470 length:279 start_codon:yes stop_codon:yes gene_type:complete